MYPTIYDDVNRITAELVVRVQAVLGAHLGGMYLFGSAAAGAFEPGVSDVDLLVATTSAASEAEFRALLAMHDTLARDFPAWDDRIEAKYLSLAALRTIRTVPARMAAISPGEPFAWEEAGPERAVIWYDVQQNGMTLCGPETDTFIDQFSEADFVECVRRHLQEWPRYLAELPSRTGSQSYAVLTMCRAIYACRTGKQVSKGQAARWAQEQFPEWADLIETALEWRSTASGHFQHDADAQTLRRIEAFVAFAGETAQGVFGANSS